MYPVTIDIENEFGQQINSKQLFPIEYIAEESLVIRQIRLANDDDSTCFSPNYLFQIKMTFYSSSSSSSFALKILKYVHFHRYK